MTPAQRNIIFEGTIEKFNHTLEQLKGEMIQSLQDFSREPIPVKILRDLMNEKDNWHCNDPLAAYRMAMVISVYGVNPTLLKKYMRSRIEIYYKKHSFTKDTLIMLDTKHVSSVLLKMNVNTRPLVMRTKQRNKMIDQLLPLKQEIYAMISLLSCWQPVEGVDAFPAELASKVVAFLLPKTRVTSALCAVDEGNWRADDIDWRDVFSRK